MGAFIWYIKQKKYGDGPSGFTNETTCFLATHYDPILWSSIAESIKPGEHVPHLHPQILSIIYTALVNISTT
jgi:hypothetical protein